MTVPSKTKYARSGDVHIAYQTVGEGPLDLVYVHGAWSHVEFLWEEPSSARFMQRLASFARLIVFDKRGTGLSDRVSGPPTLEERMDDVRAVMDAVGSERAALFGFSEGGPMSMMFAATYPERTAALVLYGTFARFLAAPQYPWGLSEEELRVFLAHVESSWGARTFARIFAPTLAKDARFREWLGKLERLAASPTSARDLVRSWAEIDVTHLLPTIHVPTLVLHRTGDIAVPVGGARFMAEQIPGARFVELPGPDHLPYVGDPDALLSEVEAFLTGVRPGPEPDRVLATILFIDVVGSTEALARMGDQRWRDLLDSFRRLVRDHLARFRGREVDTAGDGFLATFDGPARAIRAACSIRDAVRALGIEVRAGLHTGECEIIADGITGIAVHIAARVAGAAGGGDVLLSSTVKDLVVGSALRFADRGVRSLKGIPGEWRLFAAS